MKKFTATTLFKESLCIRTAVSQNFPKYRAICTIGSVFLEETKHYTQFFPASLDFKKDVKKSVMGGKKNL